MTIDIFSKAESALTAWLPQAWPIATDWQPVVSSFLASGSARRLGEFLDNRLSQGATVYPVTPFRALELTPLREVKVVILGQDPYHGAGQAHGLAFSVPQGVRVPPSLRNIQKEILRDEQVPKLMPQASLEHWARQGVLLLNTCLTVEDGAPASHAKQGWEVLTDAIIQAAWEKSPCVVFMLWGAHAQAKVDLLRGQGHRHRVLLANHPSPLSALRPPRPFIGCGHFGLANAHLVENGLSPIRW